MKTSNLLIYLFAMVGMMAWQAGAEDAKPKRKVLFLTKSAGFVHDVVKRPAPDKLALAEEVLTEIGASSGAFEVTCTQDPADINAENLKKYDAVFFYTTGELAIPNKHDLLDFVKNGKGFIGSHCAVDTFRNWQEGNVKPYIEMIGAEFQTHHAQETARIEVVDPKFPAVTHIEGPDFTINDEWYIFKNVAPDIQPVLVLDTKSMKQENYNSLAPYPNTWRKNYGQGRVFYTALGHRGDVWHDARFQKMILNGIRWAMRDL